MGRPALLARLLVGLDYLKHLSQVRDEVAAGSWLESAYWQYFCGEVQEKALAFPIDARLYHKARRALVRLARELNLSLRQSYVRVGKKAFARQGRVVTTSQAGWVVGMDAAHGNPDDGATLRPAVEQVEKLTGVKPEEAFVDKGYRGTEHHPAGGAAYLSGRKNRSRRLTKLLRRRSASEPVSGHAGSRPGPQSSARPDWRAHQCEVERRWMELEKALARVCRKPSPLHDILTFSGTTNYSRSALTI